jgi:hypothetical protein
MYPVESGWCLGKLSYFGSERDHQYPRLSNGSPPVDPSAIILYILTLLSAAMIYIELFRLLLATMNA